jgi:hypothetical protein
MPRRSGDSLRVAERGLRLVGSVGKSTPLGDGCNVSRSVEHTYNHDGVGERAVINGIRAVIRHAEAGAKLLARRRGKGEVPYGFDRCLNRRDEPGSDLFRCLVSNVSPNFGEIGFSGISKANG